MRRDAWVVTLHGVTCVRYTTITTLTESKISEASTHHYKKIRNGYIDENCCTSQVCRGVFAVDSKHCNTGWASAQNSESVMGKVNVAFYGCIVGDGCLSERRIKPVLCWSNWTPDLCLNNKNDRATSIFTTGPIGWGSLALFLSCWALGAMPKQQHTGGTHLI